MNRYVLTCTTAASAFNAGSKAPADVNRILADAGCTILENRYMVRNRLLRLPMILVTPVMLALRIKPGSQLIFQHPYDTAHNAIRVMNRILLVLLKPKKVSTAVLVHDVEAMRFQKKDINAEARLLNRFDMVVVHSPRMHERLLIAGLSVRCRVMGLFDYLVSSPNVMPRERDGGVCFAGNLGKSVFVSNISEVKGVDIHLYGAEPSSLPQCPRVTYEGRFAPDDLSGLQGGWGLVWDGDSIDSCQGALGEYLSVNSPHKASMYICAGLPLIVPAWSAVAREVEARNLGIAVSSLRDMAARISMVTEEEYAAMKESVAAYARTLMAGAHVRASLSPNMFHMQKI